MTNFRHSSENNVNTQLSRKEMLAISSEIAVCFSPDIAHVKSNIEPVFELSREELLEVSQKISLYYAPTRLSTSQKLVILPIDPQHLYVYWDLGENQAPAFSQQLANNELSLSVFSQCDEGKIPLYKRTVHELQAGKIIKLKTADKTTVYSASIGRPSSGNGFVSLIKSNETHAFQGKEGDKRVKSSDNIKSTAFIDFVKHDNLDSDTLSAVSCFTSTNHSANGKKA